MCAPCGCGKKSKKYWGELEKLQRRFPQFGSQDLYRTIEWFHSHSLDGAMQRTDFVEAMGFTAHAGYIFERMFDVMDTDGDGKVAFLPNG